MQHLRDLKQEPSSFVGILVFCEQLEFYALLRYEKSFITYVVSV